MKPWSIFTNQAAPHDGLQNLPPAPPWRQPRSRQRVEPRMPVAVPYPLDAEEARGKPIRVTDHVERAINAALYLRRPLLVTGKPGVGKSSLAYAVAWQLRLGPVLKWPITSRATVKSGLYDYDAVGRLQDDERKELGAYFRLGPLGTALIPTTWPRVLLIDEIDKGDLDLPNDLLNVLEDGTFEIPELVRAKVNDVPVRVHGADHTHTIPSGRIECDQFPFIVMTSNGEREFPAAFLRRCIRVTIPPPTFEELQKILDAHIGEHLKAAPEGSVEKMIRDFLQLRETQEIATDQLLNAAFLVLGDGRTAKDQDADAASESVETFKLLAKQLTTTEST